MELERISEHEGSSQFNGMANMWPLFGTRMHGLPPNCPQQVLPLALLFTPLKVKSANLPTLQYEPTMCKGCKAVLNPHWYASLPADAARVMYLDRKRRKLSNVCPFAAHEVQSLDVFLLPCAAELIGRRSCGFVHSALRETNFRPNMPR